MKCHHWVEYGAIAVKMMVVMVMMMMMMMMMIVVALLKMKHEDLQ